MSPKDAPNTGEAVARWRYRRGFTQEQLAELSSVSVSAIKSIERGARNGRMATLAQLARALGVSTTDLLVPTAGAPVMADTEPDGLLAVRRALTPPLGVEPAAGESAPSAEVWRETLRYAERLYADDRYDDALAAVPVLLETAHEMRAADPAAGALPLAQANMFTAQILTQVRQLDLANHALDKAMGLAQEASDEMTAAWVVSIQCWTLLLQRRFREVEQLATTTAQRIEPRMSEPGSPEMATWGWLMLRASAAALRDARTDDADEYMRMGRTASARLGQRLVALRWMPPPVAAFCETTVAFKEVENVVLLGDYGKALELADQVPGSDVPTPNNRNRHQLDIAASQIALHRPEDAVETLLGVRQAAPVWLRHQGYARGLVSQLVESRRRVYAEQVGVLADHVGVTI